LHVQANKLTTLAKEISHLQQLEILDISWNQITALPEKIGAIKTLKNLNITGTGIKQIPPSLAQLDHLETIAYTYGREGDWYKLSWLALLIGEYQESIDALLRIRPAVDGPYLNHSMDSRLALAYVLNNEWDKAITVFDSWERRIKPPFMEVKEWCITTILEDIALLKKAGITHSDFEDVKTLFDANPERPVFEDVKLISTNKNN